MDGIKDLSDEATSPLALGVLANMLNEEPHAGLSDVHDEITQASLARTIFASVRELLVYRVRVSKAGSVRPKARNRARKEVTQLEQRQYRQQFLGAKISEHKSWVDNDVYELVDMNKHPPTIFSKVDVF